MLLKLLAMKEKNKQVLKPQTKKLPIDKRAETTGTRGKYWTTIHCIRGSQPRYIEMYAS